MTQSDQVDNHTARFKFETVLEVLRTDRSRSEIAVDNDIPEETLSDWLETFRDTGHRVFETSGQLETVVPLDATLENFIESVPEMVMVLNKDGQINRVNSVLLETLGYEESELRGKKPAVLLASTSVDELLRGQTLHEETRFRTHGGTPIPVSVSVTSLTIEGNSERYLCFARNISELSEARERLQEEKNRFRAIYEEAPVGLWEQDMSRARERVVSLIEDGVDDLESYLEDHPEELREIASSIETLSVNRQLLDILDARDRNHLLQNLNNVFTDETYDVFRDEMVKFFQEGETSYRTEVNVQTVNGEPRTVLFSLNHPDIRADDWSWVFITYRDITERKRVQEELAKNEERFRQLAENIDSVFWIQSLETGENLYVSPAVEKITGQSRRVFIRDPEAFLDMVHPEDHDRVSRAFHRAKENRFLPPDEYEVEYRIVKPDGEIRWLHDRAFPVRNDEGTIYRVAGIAEDITERKEMEQRLEQSLAEKDTLLQEVHHRVKNNMQIISSLLRLQSYQVEDKSIQQHFLDCQQRVRSMVMVHERLYRSEQLSDIDLNEYLRQLVAGLINSYSTDREPEVTFEIQRDSSLSLDDTIACGLIVNELVSNAIEHGFDESIEHPEITVSFQHHEGTARLTVRDNGLGLPEDLDVATLNSLGLQLLESITATQLDGDYAIRGKNGTEVEVTFPINKEGANNSGG